MVTIGRPPAVRTSTAGWSLLDGEHQMPVGGDGPDRGVLDIHAEWHGQERQAAPGECDGLGDAPHEQQRVGVGEDVSQIIGEQQADRAHPAGT